MVRAKIADERIQLLNDRAVTPGAYAAYWMQQSQRAEYNHALEYAIQQANELNLPVHVFFGLTDDYPEANLRHYTFMLEVYGKLKLRLPHAGSRWPYRKVIR